MLEKIADHLIVFIISIFSIVFGVLMIFINKDIFSRAITIILGGCLLINSLFLFIEGKGNIISTLSGVIYIVLALLVMFFDSSQTIAVIEIILGICCILLPIVRIIMSDDKKWRIKLELPSIVIGATICFVSLPVFLKYALIVLLILTGISGIVYVFIAKEKNPIDKSDVIDI